MHKRLAPGEDMSADTKLEELSGIKMNAKEWFRNGVDKILRIQIQRHKLIYKISLNDFFKRFQYP